MSARFEVVRTGAEQPWHARFRAANGRIVWTTEQYTSRRNALFAIDTFLRIVSPTHQVWLPMFGPNRTQGRVHYGTFGRTSYGSAPSIEVRLIDERGSES